MTTTETVITVELGSDCSCEDYNEETGEVTASNYCWGCWEDGKDWLESAILNPWLESNGVEWDSPIRIDGKRMGWTNASGHLYTRATIDGLLKGLVLERADFRLAFSLDGQVLTCVRYSHDEPTGAGFALSFVTEDDWERNQ